MAPLELPVATSYFDYDVFVVELTFEQTMDTVSIPPTTDFTLHHAGGDENCDFVAYLHDKEMNLNFNMAVPPAGPVTVDYTKGVVPIKTADMREYDSWLALPVTL